MESIPMARYSYIIAFAVLLIFAGGAFADSMTFTNPGSNVWQGVYVNPYTGLDTTDHTTLTLYCDDYNTEFSGNPTWNATIAPLAPGGNFLFSNVTSATVYDFTLDSSDDIQATAYTTFPGAFNLYLEAAYLFGRIQTLSPGTQTPAVQGEEQELSAAS
jgi:hypothetical protein